MDPISPVSVEKISRDISIIDDELEQIHSELEKIENKRKTSLPPPVSEQVLRAASTYSGKRQHNEPQPEGRRLSLNLSPRRRQISSLCTSNISLTFISYSSKWSRCFKTPDSV